MVKKIELLTFPIGVPSITVPEYLTTLKALMYPLQAGTNIHEFLESRLKEGQKCEDK